MLKRDIAYEDFDGNKVTETFYFNLSKAELIDYQTQYIGGFVKFIQAIIDAKNESVLVQEFKKIILMSYGVKSEDGKRFIKSDQLKLEFTQTAAYDALFTELATVDGAGLIFIQAILPADLRGDENETTNVTQLPPPPKVS